MVAPGDLVSTMWDDVTSVFGVVENTQVKKKPSNSTAALPTEEL